MPQMAEKASPDAPPNCAVVPINDFQMALPSSRQAEKMTFRNYDALSFGKSYHISRALFRPPSRTAPLYIVCN